MPVEYFWATGTNRPITELSEYILISFFFDSHWGAENTTKREEVKATWCLIHPSPSLSRRSNMVSRGESLRMKHYKWELELQLVQHFPPKTESWEVLFKQMDIYYLFFICMRSKPHLKAVLEFVRVHSPQWSSKAEARAVNSEPDQFSALPVEIQQEILEHLPLRDRVFFGSTTRRNHAFVARHLQILAGRDFYISVGFRHPPARNIRADRPVRLNLVPLLSDICLPVVWQLSTNECHLEEWATFEQYVLFSQYLTPEKMSPKYFWGTEMAGPITGLSNICIEMAGSNTGLSDICLPAVWELSMNEGPPAEWATLDQYILFSQYLTPDKMSPKYFWGTEMAGPITGLSDICFPAVWLLGSHTGFNACQIFLAHGYEGTHHGALRVCANLIRHMVKPIHSDRKGGPQKGSLAMSATHLFGMASLP
ncbi:hypothetical protein FB451DRAFT_1164939 [Mycena latifolia]|nr:hypothetical protein FB451DRAFT_1164939 [Mycena latifolia]